MSQMESGGVSYKKADSTYFEKRHLQRYAGIWSLWALGVGAVISGHFSGWNFGFATGGWGGMLVAAIIIGIMYIGLVFCIAEMSPALPHTGAAYSFGRTAMGPWGGFITGLCENVEYVVTPAVIAFFIGSYLTGIFETPAAMQPVWWVITYLVFLALNIFGVALSFRVTLIVTILSLAVLVIFWFSAIPNMDFSRWALNIGTDVQSATIPIDALKAAVATLPADIAALVTGAAADAKEIALTGAQYAALSPELQQAAKASHELAEGNGPLFPFGFSGVLATLPLAVWLFLAIEQLPLAAEESVDPKRDMPRGIIVGMLTLVVSAFMIVLLNPSVIGVGAHKLGTSGEPLLDGFRAIYGGLGAKTLGLVALVGLIASFHTIIFAMGRQVYSLSRAGYFPSALSVTHETYKTPYVAMVVGAILGLSIMLIVWFALGGENAGTTIGVILLNMAVFGAMFSYILQAVSFILLRKNQPHIERPYRSPLGIPGAVVTIIIGLVTLYYQIGDPLFFKGVVWVGVWFVLAIIYFAAIGRHKLILSPEEEFAMEHRAKA